MFKALLPTLCHWCQCTLTSEEHFLCRSCHEHLPYSQHGCQRCATPLPEHQNLCGQCLKSPPAIDALVTRFDYQYPINHWLTQFKFNKAIALANWLGDELTKAVCLQQNSVDAVIAIPLHDSRIRQRGYNQSRLIALRVAHNLSLPLIADAIIRHKPTDAQSGLSLKERQKNIKQAFSVVKELPAHIALIDDVFTTGSTLNEVAFLAKQNHCLNVYGWTVAHAPLL